MPSPPDPPPSLWDSTLVPVRSCLKVREVPVEMGVGAASVQDDKAVQTEGASTKPRTLKRRLRRKLLETAGKPAG